MNRKLQDSTSLHALSKYINNEEELVINGRWVYRLYSKSPRKMVFFVLTEMNIYLFSSGNDRDILALGNEFSLYDIQQIDIIDSFSFVIHFRSKTMKFQEQEASIIIPLISAQIAKIMIPREYPMMPKGYEPKKTVGRNYFSVITRLKAKFKQQEKKLDTELLAFITNFCANESEEFIVSNCPNFMDSLDIILDSLEIEPLIHSLTFKKMSDSEIDLSKLWHILANHMKKNTTITELSFEIPLGRGFYEFCTAILKNQNLSIQKLEFKNLSLSSPYLEALRRVVESKPNSSTLQAFSMIRCSINDSSEAFINLIQAGKPGPKTESRINSFFIESINLSRKALLLETFFQLSSISLRGTCVELSSLLSFLSSSHVKYADFSKSSCSTPILTERNLPQSLQHLVLDYIKWSPENLLSLFKILSVEHNPLLLSIKDAQMINDVESWRIFFAELEKSNISLSNVISFIWANNPLTKQVSDCLIRGIMKSSSKNSKICNLEYISFAGCEILNPTILTHFLEFSEFIKGIDLRYIGPKICIDLLPFIRRAKNLEKLDISQNELGTEKDFLNRLNDIISMKNVDEIHIEGNSIDNYQMIKKIVEAIQKRTFPIFIPYPKEAEGIPESSKKGDPLIFQLKSFMKKPQKNDNLAHDEIWKYEWERRSHLLDKQEIVIPSDEEETQIFTSLNTKKIHFTKETLESEKETFMEAKVTVMSWAMDVETIPQIGESEIIEKLKEKYSLNQCKEMLSE